MDLRHHIEKYTYYLRHTFKDTNRISLLALLGIIVGALTALIIIAFRFLIEFIAGLYIPLNEDNFEALDITSRFLAPLIGAITIGGLLYFLSEKDRKVGVGHVIIRLEKHQGYLPFKNGVVQFLGAAIAAASGQSVGREGPAVHLGAVGGSWLGKRMRAPFHSLRVLIACGVAAAISTSFNTPIAGVIFAIEVVLMEYRMVSLIPVVLASVTGALFAQWTYGSSPAFNVPDLAMNSFWEIPFIVVLGIGLGALAAGFIEACQRFKAWLPKPILIQFILAGLLTGVTGIFVPEVLGIGYDTVNQSLAGNVMIMSLTFLILTKLILTAVNVAIGMPAGLIGPTLVMGAAFGALMGLVGQTIWPEHASDAGFYAMLGMGGMMAATLQAPLTALMSLMELTNNPNIILPGMLVIVIASLTASELFKKKSLFITMIEEQGENINADPVIQSLRNTHITKVMERAVEFVNRYQYQEELLTKLEHKPTYLVVMDNNEPVVAMPTTEAHNFLQSDEVEDYSRVEENGNTSIDMLGFPAERLSLQAFSDRGDLKSALDELRASNADLLIIEEELPEFMRLNKPKYRGLVSQQDINRFHYY